MASLNTSMQPIIRAASPRRLAPTPRAFSHQQIRAASANAAKYKRTDTSANSKKKKTRTTYRLPDLKVAQQYSLCDAMRYIRAFEVGRPGTSPKYELSIRFKTLKNGPVVRNRLRLPHPVDTSTRVCVICPPDSKAATAATDAGATIVGQDDVIAKIKDGIIDFDRCICHPDSLPALNKAGLGRVLGPRGLMPSVKTNTVLKDVGKATKDMMGGSTYRERDGVVRLAVGQLAHGPDEMQRNIKALVENIKKDLAQLSDRISKEIHEIVLSSTSSPGFSLNGDFRSADSVPTASLSTV